MDRATLTGCVKTCVQGPRLSGAVGSANRGLSEGLLTPGMEFAMHEAQSLGIEVGVDLAELKDGRRGIQ